MLIKSDVVELQSVNVKTVIVDSVLHVVVTKKHVVVQQNANVKIVIVGSALHVVLIN